MLIDQGTNDRVDVLYSGAYAGGGGGAVFFFLVPKGAKKGLPPLPLNEIIGRRDFPIPGQNKLICALMFVGTLSMPHGSRPTFFSSSSFRQTPYLSP